MSISNNLFAVYLECRSAVHESAKAGAQYVLRSISHDWFNDSSLTIEDRYEHLLSVKP